MSRLKVAIVCILCLAALLGLYIILGTANENAGSPVMQLSDSARTPPVDTEVDATEPPISQPKTDNSLLFFKDPDTSQLAESAMWPATELPPTPPQIRTDVPDLELYTIDREKFVSARPGDKLTIPLPKLKDEVELWVETAYKNPSGSLTLMGKVNGYQDYSFTMTLGHKSTFATIGTTQGVFNLRGDERHVWAGLGRSFNHHVDPNQPDYRVTPEI